MEPRLTHTQLDQIVAEVQELSERQQAELDAVQVREILRELNLPPELLEEALIQLQRRSVLATQERRNRWIVGGAIAAIALLIVGGTLWFRHQQHGLAQVTVQRDRLTLAQDDGGQLTAVSRQAGEVFYRVTLADAPVGQQLSLSCNWIDPSGQIVHQNRYQTRSITTPIWNTYCRYTPGANAPVGTWTVEAFLGDRRLSDETFDVN